jgi:signal transduction histidine kinase
MALNNLNGSKEALFRAVMALLQLGCMATLLLSSSVWAAESNGGIDAAGVRRISIGQTLRPEEENQWVEAEGAVSFVGRRGEGVLNLELSSATGSMPVTVVDANEGVADLLAGSRIRVRGVCKGLYSSADERLVCSVLGASMKNLTILQVPLETWQRYPAETIRNLTGLPETNLTGRIAHVRCRIEAEPEGDRLVLTDGSGRMTAKAAGQAVEMTGAEVEAIGLLEREGAETVLWNPVFLLSRETGSQNGALPELTTTEQVRWLSPKAAAGHFSVKIRGVITLVRSTGDSAGNIQDETGGIYVWNLPAPSLMEVNPGDFCELEGVTSSGEFSPGIRCRKVKILGEGQFPKPRRPSWNELVSGSLDAQWVEVQGAVLSVTGRDMQIGIKGGRVLCSVSAGDPLEQFLDAVVRVRGVVMSYHDAARRINGGQINVPSREFIEEEAAAPRDPFSAPLRAARELLYYHPGESGFQRVKVAGQVVHIRDGVCYLMDGTNGLRVNCKSPVTASVGDLVEAVGFPEINDPIESHLLTLRESLVRRMASEPLPAPQPISADARLNPERDATRVVVEARLIATSMHGAEQVLELQSGARTFLARLETSRGRLPAVPAGSRLELTGLYLVNTGNASSEWEAGPFELLLNSPRDVRVLERPSWWTTQHALTVVSGMALVIVLALVWISLLRHQVGKRTAELSAANRSLKAEMGERERAENELVQARTQHLIELERARIARDIHDELGCNLAQIRLLSEMTLARDRQLPEVQAQAARISDKALEAARIMDEIVWAVDPHNDTLEGLLNYVFNFASEYLALAGIPFRIDAPARLPQHALSAQVRHHLFMALKETLTNAVTHARATEVWFRVRIEDGAACFAVEDNGCGFQVRPEAEGAPGASGLRNLQKRLAEIGGSVSVESAPGQGTKVRFILPLAHTGCS